MARRPLRIRPRTGQGACDFTVAADWAEFGFGPHNKRYNPCEDVLGTANVARLGTLWSFATGNVVDSSPAVTNGVVYVGSFDDNVYAASLAAPPAAPAGPPRLSELHPDLSLEPAD